MCFWIFGFFTGLKAVCASRWMPFELATASPEPKQMHKQILKDRVQTISKSAPSNQATETACDTKTRLTSQELSNSEESSVAVDTADVSSFDRVDCDVDAANAFSNEADVTSNRSFDSENETADTFSNEADVTSNRSFDTKTETVDIFSNEADMVSDRMVANRKNSDGKVNQAIEQPNRSTYGLCRRQSLALVRKDVTSAWNSRMSLTQGARRQSLAIRPSLNLMSVLNLSSLSSYSSLCYSFLTFSFHAHSTPASSFFLLHLSYSFSLLYPLQSPTDPKHLYLSTLSRLSYI